MAATPLHDGDWVIVSVRFRAALGLKPQARVVEARSSALRIENMLYMIEAQLNAL
jgi:hypothetical protein